MLITVQCETCVFRILAFASPDLCFVKKIYRKLDTLFEASYNLVIIFYVKLKWNTIYKNCKFL